MFWFWTGFGAGMLFIYIIIWLLDRYGYSRVHLTLTLDKDAANAEGTQK